MNHEHMVALWAPKPSEYYPELDPQFNGSEQETEIHDISIRQKASDLLAHCMAQLHLGVAITEEDQVTEEITQIPLQDSFDADTETITKIPEKTSERPSPIATGKITSETDRDIFAQRIANNEVIIVQLGVFGLLGKADTSEGITNIFKKKEDEDAETKFITVLARDIHDIVGNIDLDRIPPELKFLFDGSPKHTEELERRIGDLVILDIPVIDNAVINGRELNERTAPGERGNKRSFILYKGPSAPDDQKFVEQVYDQIPNQGCLGVTSANITEQGTTLTLDKAMTFARETETPLLSNPKITNDLENTKSKPVLPSDVNKGLIRRPHSYNILEIGPNHIAVRRFKNMNLPLAVIKEIWSEMELLVADTESKRLRFPTSDELHTTTNPDNLVALHKYHPRLYNLAHNRDANDIEKLVSRVNSLTSLQIQRDEVSGRIILPEETLEQELAQAGD